MGLYLIKHFVVNREVGEIRIQLISKEAKSIKKKFLKGILKRKKKNTSVLECCCFLWLETKTRSC